MANADQYLQGWLEGDITTSESLNIKLIYIDMFDSLVDGAIFSRIMFWTAPNKRGRPKLTIQKKSPLDGKKHYWLAKRYEDWWDECRVPERTARAAIKRMVKLGLLEKQIWHFQGSPVVHVRVVAERFRELVQAVQNGTIAQLREEILSGKKCQIEMAAEDTSIWHEMADTTGTEWQIQLAQNDRSIYMEALLTPRMTPHLTAYVDHSSSKDSEIPDPPDATALPADDDEDTATFDSNTLVEQVLISMGLAPPDRARIQALGDEQALALTWMAQQNARRNPAGLLLTMLARQQQPPDELLALARRALDAGITERAQVERQRLSPGDIDALEAANWDPRVFIEQHAQPVGSAGVDTPPGVPDETPAVPQNPIPRAVHEAWRRMQLYIRAGDVARFEPMCFTSYDDGVLEITGGEDLLELPGYFTGETLLQSFERQLTKTLKRVTTVRLVEKAGAA